MVANETIEQQARLLAEDNRKTDPDITKVYWFPHDEEVRLVELTEMIPAAEDKEVLPFYFQASPKHGLPAPTGIALIRPHEFGVLKLPAGWGDWNQAVEL